MRCVFLHDEQYTGNEPSTKSRFRKFSLDPVECRCSQEGKSNVSKLCITTHDRGTLPLIRAVHKPCEKRNHSLLVLLFAEECSELRGIEKTGCWVFVFEGFN